MMQELEIELSRTRKPVVKINISILAISHLITHHNIFGCVDFRGRKVFGIPYEVCPDQVCNFKVITE